MPVSPFDRNNYTPSAPSAPSTATASSDTGVSKSKKRRAPPPPGVAAPRDSSPGQSARPLLVVMSVPFHWSSCRSRSTGLRASPYRLVCVPDPISLDANPLYASSPQVFMPVLPLSYMPTPFSFMPVLFWSPCQLSAGLHTNPSLLVSMPVLLFWSPCQLFSIVLNASPSLLLLIPVLCCS